MRQNIPFLYARAFRTLRKFRFVQLCVAAALFIAAPLSAQPFPYPSQSVVAPLASVDIFALLLPADRAQLTERNTLVSPYGINVTHAMPGGFASAIWYVAPVAIDSFTTRIRFRITDTSGGQDPNGRDGGDGFALVLQTWSPSPIGGTGYGLGYDGIRQGIAIELDTWDDTRLDADLDGMPDSAWIDGEDGSNHLAVHSNGSRALSAIPRQSAVYRSVDDIPDVSDGAWHDVSVSYRRGVLEVFIDDCRSPYLAMRIGLDTLLGSSSAYVGITGGSQLAYQTTTVSAWCWNSVGCGCGPCLPDTTVVLDTVVVRDTVFVTKRDTVFSRDTTHLRDTVFQERLRVDTLTVEVKTHDTLVTVIRDTLTVVDTLWFPHTDTVWIRDTQYIDTCLGFQIPDSVCGYVTRSYREQPGVELFIRPNPASDVLQCDVTAPGIWTLIIVDVRGIMVYGANGDRSSVVSVDVSRLVPGSYFVRLICGDERREALMIVRR